MELTPRRQQAIAEHVSETRRLMLDHAFELNDLVRFAISAAKEKHQRSYYPMDPVNDGIRQWTAFAKKLAKLQAEVARNAQRLGVPPFDAEAPAGDDAAG